MRTPTYPRSNGKSPATLFSDPAAVDAWDRWFRWRSEGKLRDLTINDTWRRVADYLGAVEGAQAESWSRQFSDAFSRWQILPDPLLLRLAGTNRPLTDLASTGAVLNVGAFVNRPGTPRALFDRDQFIDAASLAVRLLDNALLARGETLPKDSPRIGIIGVADALHSLDLPYESEHGRQFAAGVASALAEGTLHGAVDLASERGADGSDRRLLAESCLRRGLPSPLVDEVRHNGTRHAQLTAVRPEPVLALFANNSSNALDPRTSDAKASLPAQIQLRAAMQPWIDAPIDYPLVCATDPDQETIELSTRLAVELGLPQPALRCAQSTLQLAIDDLEGKA